MPSVYRKIYVTLILIVIIITAAWVFAYSWKVQHTSELATVENPQIKNNQPASDNNIKKETATSTEIEQPESTSTLIATSSPELINDKIKLTNLKSNDLVASPLVIDGEARGSWFFEGVFPIELRDANSKLISTAQADAIGDWMTSEFVPFNAKLTFSPPETATGTLILKKDNPSGLPENDDEMQTGVRFK